VGVWQCSQALLILEFALGPDIITPSHDLTRMNVDEKSQIQALDRTAPLRR
jgi:hypothetical protein